MSLKFCFQGIWCYDAKIHQGSAPPWHEFAASHGPEIQPLFAFVAFPCICSGHKAGPALGSARVPLR